MKRSRRVLLCFIGNILVLEKGVHMKDIKRLVYIVLISVILLFTMTACKKEKETINVNTTTKSNTVTKTPTNEATATVTVTETPDDVDPMEGKVISKLTGLPISEEISSIRPVGVMINNIPAALPQSGIGQADVIFETLVEGGQTRLFAIFQEYDGKKIGPVRSARHYFLNFALDFDAVYIHYGESYLSIPKYSEWKVDHMNGLSYLDEIMCFRTSDRKAPHNAYTSYKGVNDALKSTKIRADVKDDFTYGIKFNDVDKDLESQTIADIVTIPMSTFQTSRFDYDADTKLYFRFQFNKKHIDDVTGEQLVAKNIIIQKANIWNIKGDKEGRLDATLVGDGSGYYVTNGAAIEITWKKTAPHASTKYYDIDGNEIKLNPGKTWIVVTNKNTKITFE